MQEENWKDLWLPRCRRRPKIMKTTLQAKDLLRCRSTILVHKFIPMPQAMKNPDAITAVDKEWKKLGTIPAWHLGEVKSKKEVILPSPAEVYRRHQKFPYIIGCYAGESIDDYWNVYGNRDMSDAWTGFRKFTLLNEKPPKGYMWSGRRLTKIQATTRPDHRWPEILSRMSKACQREEQQQWAIEKTKARQCSETERHLFYRSG